MKANHKWKVLFFKDMHLAWSNIHISFDLWTSKNFLSFIGVMAHFISRNSRLQTTLIGLWHIICLHVGKVVTKLFISSIKKYEFEKRLGYFVLDSAISNDSYNEIILVIVWRNFLKKKWRLQFVRHIINLAAKVFLYWKNKLKTKL